jgi:anaerobic selenocysteine-containing dehydrogenase
MPFGSRTTSGEGALPALTVKLTRETSLMPDSGVALMNPRTAGALGLRERSRAVIETAAGRLVTRIVFDSEALPGVAHVAVGPRSEQLGEDGIENEDILSVCEPDQDGCWRAVAARIVEA